MSNPSPIASGDPQQVSPFALFSLMRELTNEIRSLRDSVEALESHDPGESLTRRQAAALLKVHPQQLARFEMLGLPYYCAGKGHSYVRHELLSFRDNLRSDRVLVLKIAKPRPTKLIADHTRERSTRLFQGGQR